MKKIITFLLISIVMVSNSHAAAWVKLRDNSSSKLSLDKQSVVEKDNLKRAWLKLEYKSTQKSEQTPDKDINQAKMLWYFDCDGQKSATSQVFQYMNEELVYSAAIDAKNAEYIVPVPESDMDIAMRQVCKKDVPASASQKNSSQAKPANGEKNADAKSETSAKTKNTDKSADKPADKPIETPAEKTETKPTIDTKKVAAKLAAEKQATEKTTSEKKETGHKPHWTYEGKEGPENWGKLNPDFATCDAGRNQSPINIETTIVSSLKPLKLVQRYPVKDIVNNGHTIQANFKDGNMLIIDSTPYLLKQVHFHAPSENLIDGKSFPLEAHFVHADSKGNLAVIGLMFKEGKANPALESLWLQMPHAAGDPVNMKSRVLPSEFMPSNRSYYRFSGSLTTPPCSEGVRWIVLKNTITASKEQIASFEETLKHHNNRPVQPLNGRIIVE